MAASSELRRDLQALRRRLWFPVVAFAVALAAAGASFIFSPADNSDASFRTRLSLSALPPLFGPETYPSMDDFSVLATSSDVLDQTVADLESQDIELSDDELGGMVTATARNAQNSIDFEVKADDGDLSLAIASSWSRVFTKMAPEAAAGLESQATANYQTQLAEAERKLESKREAVAELGVVVLPGGSESAGDTQSGALDSAYQAKVQVLAAEEAERTETVNLLNTLRSSVAGGATLSSDQLRLLLGSIVPPEAIGEDLTAAEAIAALELRSAALADTIGSLKTETDLMLLALDARSVDLEQAMAELGAAEENYIVASRLAQSYLVVGDTLEVSVSLIKQPHVRGNALLDWAGRFGAAAALAVVVGVLGALALDRAFGGNDVDRTRRPARSTAPLPRPPVPPSGTRFAAVQPPARQPRKKWERPMQFGASALAVVLLLGVLGTLTRRHRPLRNRKTTLR